MSEALSHFREKLAFETDAWDLNEMLQRRQERASSSNSRSETAFAQEHIPGATNFPHRTMQVDTHAHDLDQDALYVT